MRTRSARGCRSFGWRCHAPRPRWSATQQQLTSEKHGADVGAEQRGYEAVAAGHNFPRSCRVAYRQLRLLQMPPAVTQQQRA